MTDLTLINAIYFVCLGIAAGLIVFGVSGFLWVGGRKKLSVLFVVTILLFAASASLPFIIKGWSC